MNLRRCAWLAAALLVLAGCQQKIADTGGVSRGRTAKPVIISLSPSTSELVGQLSFQTILSGRTSEDDYPQTVLQAPIVVRGMKPDYERIAALKPDYVVYDTSLYSKDDIAKIEQLGGEKIPFSATTVDDFIKYGYKIAAEIGGETTMSEYLDKVYDAAETARGSAPENGPRAAILLGSGGRYYAAGTKSFQGNIISISGGKVVGPESSRFEEMSVESLVAANPELIISDGHGADILKDPRLAGVSAVKNKRVVNIDPDVLLRAGARVHQLIEAISTLIIDTHQGGSN